MVFNYEFVKVGDAESIANFGENFYNESMFKKFSEWNKEYIKEILKEAIPKDTFFGVKAVDSNNNICGMLLGTVVPSPLMIGTIACEQVWYVSPEYRRRTRVPLELLSIFFEWAKAKNCDFITMGSSEGVSELDRAYRKLGFKKMETTWMRRV